MGAQWTSSVGKACALQLSYTLSLIMIMLTVPSQTAKQYSPVPFMCEDAETEGVKGCLGPHLACSPTSPLAFWWDTCGLLEAFRSLERAIAHRRYYDPVEQSLLPSDGLSLVLSYLEL